jgi:hypothetical protein
MNENDLTKDKVKEEKVKKTTKAITKVKVEAKPVEVKAGKGSAKKTVTAKAEVEPKAKESKAKTEEIVEAVAQPKAEKIKAAAQTKEVAEIKKATESKSKVTKGKAEKVQTAAPKVSKPKAEKVEVLEEEVETATLPLAAKIQTQENFDLTQAAEEVELSPVFKELAEPKLPALREENRAFLQIQSPTRVFFYWALKQDSFNTLRRALGNRADDYFLAIRLTNLGTNREEIHQVESKGSWWFNQIEADSKYRAEVGFYAPGRPFVRIVFSNTLETPRQKPSSNTAYQPYFAVTADQFAEVLDLAGFSEDAFEVYLQGDEPQFADQATEKAFAQLAGKGQIDFSSISLNELRYVLFALASGVSLFALRDQVSGDLFEFLAAMVDENPSALTEEKVILALEEFFGFSPFDEEIEEEFGAPTVFGASLINFPKQLKRKKSGFNPEGKLSPLSSFSLK